MDDLADLVEEEHHLVFQNLRSHGKMLDTGDGENTLKFLSENTLKHERVCKDP
jgi:hypothetical protein